MNLTKSVINKTVQEKCGDIAVQVAEFLQKNKPSTEFEISEQIDIEVNKIRKALYKMVDANIASFFRKRDVERNIYVYKWEFHKEKVKDILTSMQKEKKNKLESRLKNEKDKAFYICVNSCTRMPFEEAVEYEFWCPECGKMMVEHDNSKTIKNIKDQLNKIK